MINKIYRDKRTPESLLESARAGDCRAREAFAEIFTHLLSQCLRARYPQDDPDLCDTASADAVIAKLDLRTSFNPSQGVLDAYLWGVAQKKRIKLRSRLRRSKQRDDRSQAIKPFDELNGREMDALWSQKDDPAIELELIESRELVLDKIDTIRPKLEIEQNQVLNLILRGERSSSAYEAIFHHRSSDPNELRIIIKRAKDCVWYHLNSIGVTRKSRS